MNNDVLNGGKERSIQIIDLKQGLVAVSKKFDVKDVVQD